MIAPRLRISGRGSDGFVIGILIFGHTEVKNISCLMLGLSANVGFCESRFELLLTDDRSLLRLAIELSNIAHAVTSM